MATWAEDGELQIYVAGATKDAALQTFGALRYGVARFAVDAIVDTNFPTRVSGDAYATSEGWPLGAFSEFRATFSATLSEAFMAAARGNTLVPRLFIARASDLPTGFTGQQVIQSAVSRGTTAMQVSEPDIVKVGENDYRVSGGDFFNLSRLSPNTKYWAALALMEARVTDGPTSLRVATPVSSIRVVSFWTNRTPPAPTITSPPNGAFVPGGNAFTLSISSNDPDRVSGGNGPEYTDVAGVHVQYAPRPTASNPSPTWKDLIFANATASPRKGWWIYDNTANTAGEGGETLTTTGSVLVQAGSNTTTAGRGSLPAGDWQIRVRTFDFGTPYPRIPASHPDLIPILSRSVTPASYPAGDISPWSTPVQVSVGAQVPPPLPLSPMNNIAMVANAPVFLSWQYRNTATPPFAQKTRSVQYRRVGVAAWTTLASNQTTASTTISLSGLTAGYAYEWRVQVTDADNVTSNWSEPARFWAVPPAGSGGERPFPENSIEGGVLGCGKHRALIFRRGGKVPVGEVTGVSSIRWARTRDDMSLASVTVSDWGPDCGALLKRLEPWAYELVLFRETNQTIDRVWEGPITLLTYEKDSVTIDAKDVMAYAYRRIIKQAMVDSGTGDTVVNRAVRVLQNAFAPDDPNLLGYLSPIVREDDAKQYRSVPEYGRTAYEEIDDMAANAGLDYCAVGRRILLWGTKHRIGTLPEFRDADLGSPPIVSVYGMSFANRYAVSDGNGVWGEATRLDEDGQDPKYGLVEILSSSWASDSDVDSGSLTAEGLAKIKASFEGFAERAIADRNPPPVVVRVPDNTTLNPNTNISIQHLVPGVVIPLRSTGTLREVVASQKLDSVQVREEGGVETITITMSPFSRDDAEMMEEGA